MMRRLEFEEWIIDVDTDSTQKYYNDISELTECQCIFCESYRVACKEFMSNVNDFFKSLGINPEREGEFAEFTLDSDNHLYLGFYHIVGKIIKGPTNVIENWDNVKLIEIDNFKFAFSNQVNLVPRDFPSPVIQLEFQVILPWLLNEKP